jgi:Zn-finger protein
LSYKFFQNKECEFFPCHRTDKINCLFCFCPLYYYECGGDFIILDNGRKDYLNYLLPHSDYGYDCVIGILKKESIALLFILLN